MKLIELFIFSLLFVGCTAKEKQIVFNIGSCALTCVSKCAIDQLTSQATALTSNPCNKKSTTSKPKKRIK